MIEDQDFREQGSILTADVVDGQPVDWTGRMTLSGIMSWVVILAITSFLCFEFSYQLFFGEIQSGGDATAIELMPLQMQRAKFWWLRKDWEILPIKTTK